MGDDTTPGQGLMDKPLASNAMESMVSGLYMQASGGIISLSPTPRWYHHIIIGLDQLSTSH